MFALLQLVVVAITTIIIFIFSSYLSIHNSFDIYKHQFYSDINDLQVYDYVVGRLHFTIDQFLRTNTYIDIICKSTKIILSEIA